jgi:2-keto-3-deoxy-L-rhamnonate aldolase RhmA
VDRVVAASARTGTFAGTVSSSPDHARELLQRGVSFVTLGSDVGYLIGGVTRDRATLASLRAEPSTSAAAPD